MRLRQELSSEQEAKLTQHHTKSTEAYQLYLKGRYQWNRRTEGGLRQALVHFEQAIGIDPAFALAWAGVADCYATGYGSYLGLDASKSQPKAKAAVLKALELDDSLAEAHITLGDVLYWGDWDWKGSEREFRLGIDLKPDYPTGHEWYSELLSAIGRHDEAVVEAKRAYERARRLDQAITWYEKALALSAERQWDRFDLGMNYLQIGDEQRAVKNWRDSYSLRGERSLADQLGESYSR